MTLKFTCPNCNKNYTVKDELQGKKARCICGTALRIPVRQIHIRTDMNGLPSTNAPDTEQADSPHKDTPLTEEHVRKSYRLRLIGLTIGILIIVPINFLRYGAVAAIITFIGGIIFTFVFLRMSSDRDRRMVKKKITYEEQKRKATLSSPQATIAAIVLVVAFCLGIVLMIWEVISGTNTFQDQFTSFFSTNIRLKIILLICNIPIFIIIIRLMMGSWQRYWQMIKWLFVPFRIISRRYWDLWMTNIEDVVLVLGINIICLFVYIMEYLLIKIMFIR